MGVLLLLFLLLLLPLLGRFLWSRVLHFNLFHSRGIPGPPPSLIWGNYRQLNKDPQGRSPLEVMDGWEAQYGRIYGYFEGSRPTLVVRDLEEARELFTSAVNRPRMVINVKPVSHSLVGLRGHRWRTVRSSLLPTFSLGKLRNVQEVIQERVGRTLAILERQKGKEIEVLGLFQGLTCEVIGQAALAMTPACQEDPEDEFLNSVREFLTHAVNPLVIGARCFPILSRILEGIAKRWSISGRMTRLICQSVEGAIENRRNVERTTGRDVLDEMMKVEGLSHEEMVANCWIFVLGGFETSASALTFTCYILSRNLSVQDQLAALIPESLDFESINQIQLLDHVISECLRLLPPVVTFVSRELDQERTIGGYRVPKGVSLLLPVWQIHRDPNLWPNPDKFDPSRFGEEFRRGRHPLAYCPFGVGQRNCIGKRFALLELKLALSMILQKFRIEPSKFAASEELKLRVPTVTLHPVGGVYLRFVRRES